jgi:hypothetical protein
MDEGTHAAGATAAGPAAAGVRIATKRKRARRDRGTRGLVKRLVRWAEELNRRCAVHGETAVFDNAAFPWVAEIEAEWRLVRAELDRLLARQKELPAFQEVVSDATQVTRDRHWKTVFLLGYGVRFERNIARGAPRPGASCGRSRASRPRCSRSWSRASTSRRTATRTTACCASTSA